MNQMMVTQLVRQHVELTAQEIDDFIHADWHEGEEHTAWLRSASNREIADWVIAGNPDAKWPPPTRAAIFFKLATIFTLLISKQGG